MATEDDDIIEPDEIGEDEFVEEDDTLVDGEPDDLLDDEDVIDEEIEVVGLEDAEPIDEEDASAELTTVVAKKRPRSRRRTRNPKTMKTTKTRNWSARTMSKQIWESSSRLVSRARLKTTRKQPKRKMRTILQRQGIRKWQFSRSGQMNACAPNVSFSFVKVPQCVQLVMTPVLSSHDRDFLSSFRNRATHSSC